MSKIFVSYSREDSRWLDDVVGHLRVLEEPFGTVVWVDRGIPGGDDFRTAISLAIDDAEVALLLVTCSFLTSDFIRENELPQLLARQAQGHLTVLPVLLEPCAWSDHKWLERLNIRPPGLPISERGRLDDVLTRLTKEVSLLLQRNRLGGADLEELGRAGVEAKRQRIERALEKCWDFDEQDKRVEDALREGRQRQLDEIEQRRRRVPARIAGIRLPSPNTPFMDRTQERSNIAQHLASGVKIVQLVGRGGMGKTALACNVLQSAEAGEWPHGQAGPEVSGIAYLSTKTRGISLDRVYGELITLLPSEQRRVLESLWAQPAVPLAERLIRLFQATSDGLYLFLFDNVEDLMGVDERLKDPELEQLFKVACDMEHGARFLLTSRRRVPLGRADLAVRMQLLNDGLPSDEATKLLFDLLQSHEIALPSAQVSDVVRTFHGVPRALELVAGILVSNPWQRVGELLGQFSRHGGPCQDGSVDIVSELAEVVYDRLDQDAVHAMQTLAVFDRSVPTEAVDYVMRDHFPGVDAPDLLRQLTRAHLVAAERQSQRVSLHPIDQAFLYQLLRKQFPQSWAAFHQSAARYYEQRQVVPPLEWQDVSELDAYVYEFDQLVRAGDYDRAACRLGIIANRMTWRGFAEKSRSLIAQLQGQKLGPEARLALHLVTCANMTVLGPLAGAVLHGRRALRFALRLGNKAAEANAHNRIGLAYRYSVEGRNQDIEHFTAALAANVEAGTPERNAWVLCEKCIALCYAYEAGSALEASDQAFAILETAGNKLRAEHVREVRSQAWQGRAFALYLNQAGEAAIAAARRAIAIWEEGGRPSQLGGYALHTIALVKASVGDYQAAEQVWRDARALANVQGHPRLDGICAFNLGLCAYLRGARDEAIALCASSSEVLQQLRMADAPIQLRQVILSRDENPAQAQAALTECIECCSTCPDFFGRELFRTWCAPHPAALPKP